MKGYTVDHVRVAQARLALIEDGQPLKQVAAAARLGVHAVTLNRIENGNAKVSLELLTRMSDLYGRSQEWLLGEPEVIDKFELARERMANALAEFSEAVDLLQGAARDAGMKPTEVATR